jgi:hypothetical protein
MKNIIFIITLLFAVNSKAAVFNIWYIENDTATTAQTFSVFVKGSYTSASDTGRIYLRNLATSTSIEVYKVKILTLLGTTPTGPNSTYELTFIIPTGYTKNCTFTANYQSPTVVGGFPCYIRSNIPDFTVAGPFGVFSGYSGFTSGFKVKWTYQALLTDSLELYLDGILFDKIALTDLEDDSIVSFVISGNPDVYRMTGNYVLTGSQWLDYTINTPIVPTGIIDPLEENNTLFKYYDIEGREIKKPIEGFFIWKSNCQSGKVYIIN